MEKLVIERTSPIQGEPVGVSFHGSKGYAGKIVITFEEWLHFSKLIKEGQDSLKKKNEQRIEILIKGVGGKVETVKKVEISVRKIRTDVTEEEVKAILGERNAGQIIEGGETNNPLLGLEQEDEKAIVKAEKEQKLVRSLIEDRGKNESN